VRLGKFSRKSRVFPIRAVEQCAHELRKRLVDPYDFEIHPSEDLKSFSGIDKKMQWILGRDEDEKKTKNN
jgi:hypothetical protein